ncbi:flagellar biosynthesis, cell-distal portion of basal-body rod [Klebsiella pneumoniae]|nr:flagellar biosynthesis, cell-distal portion of basal-body rod [Klebsiella pneumoniae]
MAELNPPLGTTTPEIFLDNVKRADELVNGRPERLTTAAVNRWIPGAR